MNFDKQFLIGVGQVGSAIYDVLSDTYDLNTWDAKDNQKLKGNCDVLHIAFPYSDSFIEDVLSYIAKLEPKLVIIHSTVEPGTTEKINRSLSGEEIGIVHSPVRGRHNELTRSLREFPKYIGSHDESSLQVAEQILEDAGIECITVHDSRITEMGKILSTFQYAAHIYIADIAKELCEKYHLPYEVTVAHFNRTYNEGYEKMNEIREEEKDFHRPVLFPDIEQGFGGHCLYSNHELLVKKLENDQKRIPEILRKLLKVGMQ